MPVIISHLTASAILDSRGYPTVECTCHLSNGSTHSASVPSGASTGSHEALELRDHQPEIFEGKGVNLAVNHITDIISPAVAGLDPIAQAELDHRLIHLDGTPQKSRLGANAILAVSLAVAKAGADSRSLPLYQHFANLANNDQVLHLPVPFFNILNGGQHAGMNLDFQEFIVIPNPASFPDFAAQLRLGAELTHTLATILKTHHLPTSVGDEGGFAPLLHSNRQAIDLIREACRRRGVDPARSLRLGFDFAANTYFQDHHFRLKDSPKPLTKAGYLTYLDSLIDTYQPLSFEDPFPEDDWPTWRQFTQKHGSKIYLIGDDFLVTHPDRLQRAIKLKACNAILIKPNQIGTVTETIAVINLAKQHQFVTVASHRSGETTDTAIADLAVGCGTDYVKFGAPVRGERVVKYNRLSRIAAALA
ncbi:phosphopyruvate hydratase [Microgenomates group bacterium RBG_16_45_19]|nr:MAG: phosphopyruvate hydratase [Microgenomates group bacterium RBG_16_45_19]